MAWKQFRKMLNFFRRKKVIQVPQAMPPKPQAPKPAKQVIKVSPPHQPGKRKNTKRGLSPEEKAKQRTVRIIVEPKKIISMLKERIREFEAVKRDLIRVNNGEAVKAARAMKEYYLLWVEYFKAMEGKATNNAEYMKRKTHEFMGKINALDKARITLEIVKTNYPNTARRMILYQWDLMNRKLHSEHSEWRRLGLE